MGEEKNRKRLVKKKYISAATVGSEVFWLKTLIYWPMYGIGKGLRCHPLFLKEKNRQYGIRIPMNHESQNNETNINWAEPQENLIGQRNIEKQKVEFRKKRNSQT